MTLSPLTFFNQRGNFLKKHVPGNPDQKSQIANYYVMGHSQRISPYFKSTIMQLVQWIQVMLLMGFQLRTIDAESDHFY